MITLTLLHPLQSVAVQTWTFEPKSVIRIGRSRNNEVTLYSAVVSRHHVELRPKGSEWELVNLGSNGTFTQGKRISRTTVVNGMIIRLAASGPQIQVWTRPASPNGQTPDETPAKQPRAPISSYELEKAKGTFPGRRTISKEELEQAKETQLD